jgi:hypothetical protein
MPSLPFTITYTQGGWECHPRQETIPHSEGVNFDVVLPPGSPGCRVCFNNPEVFGAPYFDLDPGKTHKEFKGPAGAHTGFHVQDRGTECHPERPDTDPYDVAIGSGPFPPKHGYK